MRHTENFVRRWLYGTRLPLAVTIAVTEKCQLRCGHCSAANSVRPVSPLSLEELQADLWKKLPGHPAFRKHRQDCRMQCPSFRGQYIDGPADPFALFP